MIVTIETSGMEELEQLLKVLQTLNISNVRIQQAGPEREKAINPENQQELIRGMFGMWKEEPRTLEDIRTKAWSRNQES